MLALTQNPDSQVLLLEEALLRVAANINKFMLTTDPTVGEYPPGVNVSGPYKLVLKTGQIFAGSAWRLAEAMQGAYWRVEYDPIAFINKEYNQRKEQKLGRVGRPYNKPADASHIKIMDYVPSGAYGQDSLIFIHRMHTFRRGAGHFNVGSNFFKMRQAEEGRKGRKKKDIDVSYVPRLRVLEIDTKEPNLAWFDPPAIELRIYETVYRSRLVFLLDRLKRTSPRFSGFGHRLVDGKFRLYDKYKSEVKLKATRAAGVAIKELKYKEDVWGLACESNKPSQLFRFAYDQYLAFDSAEARDAALDAQDRRLEEQDIESGIQRDERTRVIDAIRDIRTGKRESADFALFLNEAELIILKYYLAIKKGYVYDNPAICAALLPRLARNGNFYDVNIYIEPS
jgi:hypothetical protein